MTLAEDNGPEHGGDDMLAAEYVLGALPADERQAAGRRIETEAAFARLVDEWEARFSPLAAGYAEVDAPSSVKAAIDRRLFTSDTASHATRRRGFWSNIGFWRALAAAAIISHLAYIAAPYFTPSTQAPATLVASLAAEGSDVKYLAVYDSERHEVGLSHVSGTRASGKDFELWMIEGKDAPVSMGVIPAGDSAHLSVAAPVREKLAQGAVLAVSVEPTGGSPTGQPTGPVVAAGDLKSI